MKGIYKMTINESGKIYIGASINIDRRIKYHLQKFKSGKHERKDLQSIFSLEFFKWEVIELTENLEERERYYIDFFQSHKAEYGYNKEKGGNKGKTFGELKEYRFGEKNPMYNKKHTEDAKNAIRMKNRGSSNILNQRKVELIKNQLVEGIDYRTIANSYNVSHHVIHKIKRCKNWQYVAEHLNHLLLKI